jgi:hypothetical protein
MSTVSLDVVQLRQLINALDKISIRLEAIEEEMRQLRYTG